MFNAEILIIHIGEKKEFKETQLENLIEAYNLPRDRTRIIWEDGDTVHKILEICQAERPDLLLSGAIAHENIVQFYSGSVAREIIRQSKCSVLLLTEPSKNPKPFSKIVAFNDSLSNQKYLLATAAAFAKAADTKHIKVISKVPTISPKLPVRPSYRQFRKYAKDQVMATKKALSEIKNLDIKTEIKVAYNNAEDKIYRVAHQFKSDLLIINSPKATYNPFDRFFRNEIETLLADLPTNLLVVKNIGT